MKKLVVLMASVFMLAACGSSSETVKGTAETAKDEKGNYASAAIELQDGKVVSIDLDEYKEGKSKKELGADYNMKPKSKIKKEWNEQVEFLESYIKKNGLEKVELNDKGYAKNDDVLAGCTININSMMEAANTAAKNAQ